MAVLFLHSKKYYMAKIKPFRGIIYNPGHIKDLSSVICPPYDVISPEQQEYYLKQSNYNFIHVLLGKEQPGQDKYLRAKEYFLDWQDKKILIQDEKPAIYFYLQRFYYRAEPRTRLGFISLMRLNNHNQGIFGHEHTHQAPKEDRLRLLQAVEANLSPIFVVFQDKKRVIQQAWQHICSTPPFLEATDKDRVTHNLWRIDDPKIICEIQTKMDNEDIFIADGHHRYEVACAFRDMQLKRNPNAPAEASFNYIMAYFTNTNKNNLFVLPIHRLLTLTHKKVIDYKPLDNLLEFFEMETIKDKTKFFFLLEKGGKQEHVIGMYFNKGYWLLRLKNVKILDKVILNQPKEYRGLDVVILNNMVLNKAFGFENESQGELLYYSPDPDDIIMRANSNPDYTVGFFLNPIRIEQLIGVALANKKMPPKSTYFYPKVASGLVVHKFD